MAGYFSWKRSDRRLAELPTPDWYCRLANLNFAIRTYPARVIPAGESGLMRVVDGTDLIHICRRERENRYKRGIRRAVDGLAGDYHLDKLDGLSGGTLIDCGANVGELGLWARARGMSYVAFEPEGPEARCCDLNNFEGRAETHRKALWKESKTLEFFSKADTADSSVFEVVGHAGRVWVEAVTLDEALNVASLPGPVVFKVEAEGAEPEVLLGALNSLPLIDHVAVDCGYERGPTQQHTVVETVNLLSDHGFRLTEAGFRRITMLFTNIARSGQA